MKKLLAIIFAILLSFVIAFGEQLLSFDFSSNSFSQLIERFKGDDKKPTIPTITEVNTPPEENLSYSERIEKGEYYEDRGFLSYAINEYAKAANLEPTQIEPLDKLMKVHYLMMNYDKSRLNAEAILKLSPDYFEAKYYLILTALKQSKFEESKSRIQELSDSGVNDVRFNYLSALLNIADKNHEEAQKLLTQVLRLESGADNELRVNAQKILSAYEEFKFASSAEELYLDELLARSLNEVEEYELAINLLKEVLKTRSDLRDAWILLGFAYLNSQQYVFASTAFERAYELDSAWPPTQYFLGLTYAELGEKEDAIIYLNYALTNGFEPKIVIQQKLADLYLETENYQKSVNAYEAVLEVNKENIDAFVKPILIYLDYLNNPEKALQLAELAAVTFPETAMSYNLLGWAQLGNESYALAEENLKKALQLDPNLAAAHFNIGQLYEETNRSDEALDSFEKAYQLDQTGSIGNMAAKHYNDILTKQTE